MDMNNNGVPENPAKKLPDDRNLLKFIIFTVVTLGIYPLAVMYKISTEINEVCTLHDKKHTANFFLMLFLGLITFGIYPLFWHTQLCSRIGDELKRRKIEKAFSACDFWIWAVLLAFVGIGPIIYWYKFLDAINCINRDYNVNG